VYSIQHIVIKFQSVTCGKSLILSRYSGFHINKIDRHDITEIVLKVALNIITLTQFRRFIQT